MIPIRIVAEIREVSKWTGSSHDGLFSVPPRVATEMTTHVQTEPQRPQHWL